MKPRSQNFEFEALEQRILLSADPISAGGIQSPVLDPFQAAETYEELVEISSNDSQILISGSDGIDLFSDLGEVDNLIVEDTDEDAIASADPVVTDDSEEAETGASSDSNTDSDVAWSVPFSDEFGSVDDSVSSNADQQEFAAFSIVDQLSASLITANGPPKTAVKIGNLNNLTVGSSHVSEDGGLLLSAAEGLETLEIGVDQKLSGSGSFEGAVINNGVVSPGNSPGIQTFTDYTQAAGATLTIEIGGLTAGTGFDQLQVSGTATLDGKLDVDLIDGFVPKAGDSFEILTYGAVSGKFADAEGLFGIAGGNQYFEVVEGVGSLELIVRNFFDPGSLSFAAGSETAFLGLGHLVNEAYFAVVPSSVAFTADLKVGNAIVLSGDFVLSGDAAVSTITLSDDSSADVTTWNLTLAGGKAFNGIRGPADSGTAVGLSITDVNLGIVYLRETGDDTSRGWLSIAGDITTMSLVGIPGLTLNTANLDFEVSYGFGSDSVLGDNELAVNYAASGVSVTLPGATVLALTDDGSKGQRLAVSGTAEFTAGPISINGTFALFVQDDLLKIAGSGVSASLGGLGLKVGVSAADFGLAVQDDGKFAFEAMGNIVLDGLDFSPATADWVAVVYNNTGVSYSGTTFQTGSFDYVTNEIVASQNLVEVAIGGLAVEVGGIFALSGDFAFKRDTAADRIEIIANSATVTFGAGDFEVGVQNADLGLVFAAEGRALEAKGEMFAKLGDAVSLNSNEAVVRWNETGIEFTGDALSTAGLSYTFDELGASTTLREVRLSDAYLVVGDFFTVRGEVAFTKNSVVVPLSTGMANVDYLTLGLVDVDAFAGFNNGTANSNGLTLSDVDLALVLASDQADDTRKWVALKADVGSVSADLLPNIKLSATDFAVEINVAAGDGTLIDFDAMAGGGFEVPTGASSSLLVDMDASEGELIRAHGRLTLGVGDFFTVTGDFGFEKSVGQVRLNTGAAVVANLLKLGASNLDAFAGIDGGTAEAVGLNLTSTDFGLLIASDQANSSRIWTSLKAQSGSVSFVGVEAVVVNATSVLVEINRAAAIDNTTLDLLAQPVSVKTGAATAVTLDADGSKGELARASGNLNLAFSDVFFVDGGFAFERSSTTINLSDGSSEVVDLLTLGAADVDAFIGLNNGGANAAGLSLTGLNFGLTVMGEKDGARSWFSLKANASEASVLGLPSVDFSVASVEVAINLVSTGEIVADYRAAGLNVSTATGQVLLLDIDGARGELIEVAAQMTIRVADFFRVEGGFAFEKSQVNLVDSAGEAFAADLLTVGASNVTAFAGLNGGSTDEVGVSMSDVNFALALLRDRADDAQTYVALQASAGQLSFAGLPGITVKADTLSVAINLEAANGRVVDFAAQTLSVTTGSGGQTIVLNMAGAAGEQVKASGNLQLAVSDFFVVSGGFAFEKSTDLVTLGDSSNVTVDKLTIGAAGVDAFAGLRAGQSNALGVSLGNANFALAILTDAADSARTWVALEATAESAALLGVPGVTLSGAIVVRSAGGDVTLNDGANGDGVGVSSNGGNIRIEAETAGGSVTVNAAIDGDGGYISVLAGNDISLNANLVTAGVGTIDIEATSGSVVMADGVVAQTDAGNLRIVAGSNVIVGLLDVRSASDRASSGLANQAMWGDVSVNSLGGSVLDAAISGDGVVDVMAANARFTSADSVGVNGAGANSLETELTNVSAAAGAGGINLLDSTPVAVGTVGPVTTERVQRDGTILTVGDAGDQSGATKTGGVLAIATKTGDPVEGFPTFSVVNILDAESRPNVLSGLYEQRVLISNLNASTIDAVRVIIRGLPAGVKVANAAGIIDGNPFIQYNLPLALGQEVSLVIEYLSPNSNVIPIAGSFLPEAVPVLPPLNPAGQIINDVTTARLNDGRLSVSFNSLNARNYYVQFSDDGQTWTTVLSPIEGTGRRIIWLDNGPPKTPTDTVGGVQRMYRVILADIVIP